MRPAARVLLLSALCPALCGADVLTDAFRAGDTLGRSGAARAHGSITSNNASTQVPGYNANPPETRYFGSAGLGPAAAGAAKCTGSDPACLAIRYSQTNPARRPQFTLTTEDALIRRGRGIAADPQAIAGNLAGTYSACSVQTTTAPPVTETRICHEYRTAQNSTCDKILIVSPVQIPGCTPGTPLARIAVDPCPSCPDQPAFDFSCTANGYHMKLNTVIKKDGRIFGAMGERDVPGEVNLQIPKTAGLSKRDSYWCYRTFYSQSCTTSTCTINVWFENPCAGQSATGKASFRIPTTTGVTDSWTNQCASFEARTR